MKAASARILASLSDHLLDRRVLAMHARMPNHQPTNRGGPAQRGQRHLGNIDVGLLVLDDVDTEVANFIVKALREDGEPDLPSELRRRRDERIRLLQDRQAGEAALTTLNGELAEARGASVAAGRPVGIAIGAVLGCRAKELARQHEIRAAEQWAWRRTLAGFARFLAGSAVLPPEVMNVLRPFARELGGMIPFDQWRDAANLLKNDPQAAVEIVATPVDTPPPGVPVSWPPTNIVERAIPLVE